MATNDPVMHALVDLVEQLCGVGMYGKLAQAHHNAMQVIRERAGLQPEELRRTPVAWMDQSGWNFLRHETKLLWEREGWHPDILPRYTIPVYAQSEPQNGESK